MEFLQLSLETDNRAALSLFSPVSFHPWFFLFIFTSLSAQQRVYFHPWCLPFVPVGFSSFLVISPHSCWSLSIHGALSSPLSASQLVCFCLWRSLFNHGVLSTFLLISFQFVPGGFSSFLMIFLHFYWSFFIQSALSSSLVFRIQFQRLISVFNKFHSQEKYLFPFNTASFEKSKTH